ncbi:MAG: DUF4145 domain-containing protein [Gemmatimonadetes bacterium]|nr:DUF4145 domain-containing protein [Gemmatimonadota bacterium]
MPKITSEYSPPKYRSDGFNCPYCGAYARQTWWYITPVEDKEGRSRRIQTISITLKEKNINVHVEVSFCSRCYQPTFWLSDPDMPKIMYPATRTSPPANDDLDDSIKKNYNEAADIANQSPRAACALLRLAIQMLLEQLGEKGHINEGIKNLVQKGLDPQIQQALDIVRVTGNHAVHPGQIDFDDSTDVQILFGLINIISDALITQPKRIKEIYTSLPENDQKAIEKRDKKTK